MSAAVRQAEPASASLPEASQPKAQLLAALPRLRAFAMSLCGHADQADDLVQETLMKAWANLGSFEPGSNMPGWLYTILRNEFYSRLRKRRHEVDDPDGMLAARLATLPAQESHLHFQDFRTALFRLPPDQREALMLVGASGMSYEDAASLCNCAVGTMKSRVNRARNRLAEMLSMQDTDRFSADRVWGVAADAPGAPARAAAP
jgi:RNA polymerase sigma-70 factor, ECF subfamily